MKRCKKIESVCLSLLSLLSMSGRIDQKKSERKRKPRFLSWHVINTSKLLSSRRSQDESWQWQIQWLMIFDSWTRERERRGREKSREREKEKKKTYVRTHPIRVNRWQQQQRDDCQWRPKLVPTKVVFIGRPNCIWLSFAKVYWRISMVYCSIAFVSLNRRSRVSAQRRRRRRVQPFAVVHRRQRIFFQIRIRSFVRVHRVSTCRPIPLSTRSIARIPAMNDNT